jgi:hypothetical protein
VSDDQSAMTDSISDDGSAQSFNADNTGLNRGRGFDCVGQARGFVAGVCRL